MQITKLNFFFLFISLSSLSIAQYITAEATWWYGCPEYTSAIKFMVGVITNAES